ncbi:MAG: gluconolaconase [Pyrinomonadaceae bacterium]
MKILLDIETFILPLQQKFKQATSRNLIDTLRESVVKSNNMPKNSQSAGKIVRVTPQAAIAGGEVFIECENVPVQPGSEIRCYFNNVASSLIAASPQRIIAIIPDDELELLNGDTEVRLVCDEQSTKNNYKIKTSHKLADDLHLVANPAVDPDDDRLIVTRSGSRGQQLPVTLFRLSLDGSLEEISGDIMNPTGIAFNMSGEMFVTSRAEGTVYRVNGADESVPFASDMGTATGIAFNQNGEMFVGDRAGTIYKVNAVGETQIFATLEQSIAAYHLAFGRDGALYVTRPNVASFDSIMKIDADGEVSIFYRGLGRPQGLAFDREGNLYVAACLRQRRGIIRITPDGREAELFVAGMNIVGLCFGRNGEMFIATNDSIFSLQLGIYGTLLS